MTIRALVLSTMSTFHTPSKDGGTTQPSGRKVGAAESGRSGNAATKTIKPSCIMEKKVACFGVPFHSLQDSTIGNDQGAWRLLHLGQRGVQRGAWLKITNDDGEDRRGRGSFNGEPSGLLLINSPLGDRSLTAEAVTGTT